jgi:hypothetical protein
MAANRGLYPQRQGTARHTSDDFLAIPVPQAMPYLVTQRSKLPPWPQPGSDTPEGSGGKGLILAEGGREMANANVRSWTGHGGLARRRRTSCGCCVYRSYFPAYEYKPSDVREAIARAFTALKKLAETADSKEQS